MNSATRQWLYRSRLLVILDIIFFLLALSSLTYTVVTTLHHGEDLATFQGMGRAWVQGIYQNKGGSFYGPPPYTTVLFSAFALLSFEQWRILLLAINLLATGLCVYLAIKLFAIGWSLKMQYYLAMLLIVWAPFRVTLRMGQISLIVTALLLASLFARKNNRHFLAGLLLGLSLSKYPLTLPFFLYFLWKREWKMVATATLLIAALTAIFALWLGMSPLEVTGDYLEIMRHTSITNNAQFAGTTEIGPLLFTMTGGNKALSDYLNIFMIVVGLTAMVLVFRRHRQCENVHFAVLALFSLWYVYHRTYDSVLCILPAALLMNFIAQKKFLTFSISWLSAMFLLALSIPGFLLERLHFTTEELSASPAGLLGLHIERFLVFGMFWSFLFFLRKGGKVKTGLDSFKKIEVT